MDKEKDPFYKKRFSLISEEEQRKHGVLPMDSKNSAYFEEQILSSLKEKDALEQILLKFKEKRALADSVLNVPRNEFVPGLDYPIERPINSWDEVIDENINLDETEINDLYKENINDPKKELQLNLILKKIKNSDNKLKLDTSRKINQLEDLITFISGDVSDKELYIISRLYDANLSFNFNLYWEKDYLKKIVDIPLFEKALSIIKYDSSYYEDISDVASCYQILQDFGPTFYEKITSGLSKIQSLNKIPDLEKIIDGEKWSSAAADPYIFEELDKLNMPDFEAAANFCLKMHSLSGQNKYIPLNDFIYLSKLFRDKS